MEDLGFVKFELDLYLFVILVACEAFVNVKRTV